MSSNKKNLNKKAQNRSQSKTPPKPKLIQEETLIPVQKTTKPLFSQISIPPILWLLIISALYWIVYLCIYTSRLDLNGDNICYYIYGKSIAQGTGYADIMSGVVNPVNHYPPGYSFLISIFYRFGVHEITSYNFINGIFGWGTVIFMYLAMNKMNINKVIVYLSSVLIALNPALLNSARINMSEAPYLCFVSLSLYAFLARKNDIKFFKDPFWYLFLVSMIMAYYIRTSGIAFVVAALGCLFVSKRIKEALATLAIFIISVIPWNIRSSKLGGNDYVAQLLSKNPYDSSLGKATFSDLIERFFKNLDTYIANVIPNDYLSYHELYAQAPDKSVVIGLIVTVFIIIGILKTIKKWPIIGVYTIISAGILLLWPSIWTGIRFLLVIVPFMVFLTVVGLNATAEFICNKLSIKWQPAILFVLLLLCISPIKALSEDVEDDAPPAYQAYFSAGEWISHQPNGDKVIVCSRKPEQLYARFGLKGVAYEHTSDAKLLVDDLEKHNVEYVILEQLGFGSTPKYLYPAIMKYPNKFKLVYQVKNPDTYVFKLIK